MRIYLSVIAFFFLVSLSGQKKVVIEKFTNSFCGQCAGASEIIKEIIRDNPNTIWVSHYKANGWLDNPLANEESWELWSEFGIFANPLGMINRKPINNSVIVRSSDWLSEVEKQSQDKYYARIEIENVDYAVWDRELSFNVNIVFDELPENGPFRVSAMIAENAVWGQEQHSYFNDTPGHPLEGRGDIIYDYQHSNVVRTIFDGPLGSDYVVPPNPELNTPYTARYTYKVPEGYREEYLKIVVLLSQHNDTDVNQRLVLNANQVELSDLNLQLTSSAEEISESFDFELIPNPSSNYLEVTFDGVFDDAFITNSEGKLFWKTKSRNDLKRINVSAFYKGVYNLSLTVDGQTVVKRFIVQ